MTRNDVQAALERVGFYIFMEEVAKEYEAKQPTQADIVAMDLFMERYTAQKYESIQQTLVRN